MSFRLFLDTNGCAQFDERGVPLFIQDGSQTPAAIDVNALHDQVRKIGGEAATHRKDKETMAEEAARRREAALEGHRKAIKKMTASLGEAKAEAEAVSRTKDGLIHDLLIKNAFASSSYLREKTVLPYEFAYASFADRFSVEYVDGVPMAVARDYDGNIIEAAPGKPAGTEEALKTLVERHHRRDAILKAPAPRGGSGSMAAYAAHTAPVSRAQLANAEAKAAFIAEHGLTAFKKLSAH